MGGRGTDTVAPQQYIITDCAVCIVLAMTFKHAAMEGNNYTHQRKVRIVSGTSKCVQPRSHPLIVSSYQNFIPNRVSNTCHDGFYLKELCFQGNV
jgi:hypothetical protein